MGDATVSGDDPRESFKCVLNALVSEGLMELDERSRADHIGMQENSEFTCWFGAHNDPLFKF